MPDRGRLEIFPGGGGAGEDKDSRADNGADTQRGEGPGPERFLQALARGFRFGDQLVDRLAAEKLVVGGADGVIRRRFGGGRLRQRIWFSWERANSRSKTATQHSAGAFRAVNQIRLNAECWSAASTASPGREPSSLLLASSNRADLRGA